MDKVQYSVQVAAPVHRVWTTMLEDASYREWTRPFQDGSHFEGSWTVHSVIRFVGPDENGSMGGLLARVVEKRTDAFVAVEYLGQVVDGEDDTESELARSFVGMRESYAFREENGVTTVTVELDTTDEMREMLAESWPRALALVKELAES